ncbi:MAG: tRNA uridine-5-carboxymethylaminomethyl(34) synthesis GTPase MnmE [Bacteroidetes bacterium]|nr:tRNA uridine-5-carboxymethylaminomethyl(34) synthesis GTPase MnmE [Bacteroidota bacterium]MDA1225953.1 tRNA uridine-5-carboxymethylaminomethyl(34) synthesis GTPase MnmE [Bacteroidota bacterium]
MYNEGTIIALSSPPGSGAISIIRLSGKDSITTADKFFESKSGKKLKDCNGYSLSYGNFLVNKEVLDEVVISLYKAPHSYTGEDVVEISCHGSNYIQQEIISSFTNSGVRLASPGEFTLRAYLNNKKDLSQAEAVSDLIASESKEAHRVAMQQMRGGYSIEIEELREKLIDFKSLIELELDFSEEDVEFADRKDLKDLLNTIESRLSSLIESFTYGNVIKEGVTVTIAGKPNAGKSSLLNALVNEDKAIVSDIPGTTRDAIEDLTVINGIKFRFIDTAGIRETSDKIESIGVERAKGKISKSRILIYLFDRSDISEHELINEVESYKRDDLNIFIVENKIDLLNNLKTNSYKDNVNQLIKSKNIKLLQISALNQTNIEDLKNAICKDLNLSSENSIVITNSRHLEALKNSLNAIESVKKGLKDGISGDLLSVDLNDAIINMSIITGKIDIDQDILGSIFSRFCIGK